MILSNTICVHLVIFDYYQVRLTKWVDGSPLTFTKWSTSDDRSFPHAIYDCLFLRCRYKQLVDPAVYYSQRIPQPHTSGNTRLCAALVYGQHSQWIMIPCNKPMKSTLQICETLQIQVHDPSLDLIENNTPYNNMQYVHYWYVGSADLFTLSSYVFEQTRGSVSLYTDFSRVMNSSTCGLHCHTDQPQTRNLPFCRDEWIMSHKLCFKLFSKISRYDNILQKQIADCISNGSLIKIDATYITRSSILDYLVKWTIGHNQSIHVLDDINEDITEYKCRNFKIGESHNDFYSPDANKLKESLEDQIICIWKEIDQLLCVNQPEIPNNTCPKGTYKCRDQSCISESYRCDSQNDCPDADDEYSCTYEWHLMNLPEYINKLHSTREESALDCVGISISLVGICLHKIMHSHHNLLT